MKQASLAVALILNFAFASAQSVPLYGQCGGKGYTGPTLCSQGACQYQNDWYSQCLPGSSTTKPPTTTAPTPTTTTAPPATTSTSVGGPLPTKFSWTSSDILISPKKDSRNIAGIKDPSIIFHEGHYHVFASTAQSSGYNLVYITFTDFAHANEAPFYYLDQSGIGTGYRAAPQVFYFAPKKLWYLVYQNGNAAYSTNPNINDPKGWTAPKTFYSKMPTIIENNIGEGYWVDMWIICDSNNCYLFSSDDNGHLYRSQTSLSNFPNGMDEPVIAMKDPDRFRLFEAANVYKVDERYLLLIEAIGSDSRRWFRSWTSSRIAGPWDALADSESNPFARANNVVFAGTAWTQDISHGEAIRTNVDQTLTLDTCNIQYLYQGMDPKANGSYNSLPWRLALLEQTNSPC